VPGLDLAAAYVPARELGGDFYDFLPYGKGRLASRSGTFPARALPPRSTLARHRHAPRARGHSLMPAAEMLATLNRRLYNDSSTHASSLCSSRPTMLPRAAHPRQRRRSLSASRARRMCAAIRLEGVPLGLIPNSEYDETTVELTPATSSFSPPTASWKSRIPFRKSLAQTLVSRFFLDFLREIRLRKSRNKSWPQPTATAEQVRHRTDDRTLVVLRVTDDSSADFQAPHHLLTPISFRSRALIRPTDCHTETSAQALTCALCAMPSQVRAACVRSKKKRCRRLSAARKTAFQIQG